MTPERWQQLERLYLEVQARPEDRDRLLAGADSEFRAELERMLAADAVPHLLDSPAADLNATGTVIYPGHQFGPYRIEEMIGEGGMGQVFRALDTRLGRKVAIKMLPRDYAADPDRRRRFQQEARAVSALNHPGIVTLYDILRSDNVDLLVMEFVSGKSLDKLLQQKALSLFDALSYSQQIAAALAAAHSAGVVHRDIKPANAILTEEGVVKVLDFGVAKLAEPEAGGVTAETATVQGQVVGTLAYMSPEQAAGKSLDHRTDIFSLGVVLYELVSGTRPFRRKTSAEILSAILHDEPPPLPHQPAELQEILAKALAKDPQNRYQHAGDFALDLSRLSAAWKSKSLPSMKTALAVRKSRWPVIAIASATVAAISLAVIWFAAGSREPVNPLAGAKFTRLTDWEGSEREAAISRDGRFVAFRSDRDGPEDSWVSQIGSGKFVNLTHGTQPLVLVRNLGFSADGTEIWLSSIINGSHLRTVPLMGGAFRSFLGEHAMDLAWSADGSRIVYQTYDPGDPVFVADGAGANARQIHVAAQPGIHNHFPTFSPDGKWIYMVTGVWETQEMDIWRMHADGTAPERLTHVATHIRYLTFLDDHTILCVAPDQTGAGPWLWAFDTRTRALRRISSGLEEYTSVDASADGRRLVVAISNPSANLWTFPILNRPAEEADVKRLNVSAVRAFSPRFGGKALFFLSSSGGGDGLWRYENGHSLEIWKGSEGPLIEPAAISPDGRRAAIVLAKNGKRTLHTLNTDGGNVRPLAPALSIDRAGSPSWSPDGDWIVVGGNDGSGTGLFKIPTQGGDPVRLLKGTASNPVWSPDGSGIIYTGPFVGILGPLKMIRPDGTPVELPQIEVRVGGQRYRFFPGRNELIYMQGSVLSNSTFWSLDLASRRKRQLSSFDGLSIRSFDVSPDGKQIVFDRLRDNSDLALIDLPQRK